MLETIFPQNTGQWINAVVIILLVAVEGYRFFTKEKRDIENDADGEEKKLISALQGRIEVLEANYAMALKRLDDASAEMSRLSAVNQELRDVIEGRDVNSVTMAKDTLTYQTKGLYTMDLVETTLLPLIKEIHSHLTAKSKRGLRTRRSR